MSLLTHKDNQNAHTYARVFSNVKYERNRVMKLRTISYSLLNAE